MFCLFDELAELHGVKKIKTIGDAYMTVAGLPNYRSDHPMSIANMALDMQQAVAKFNEEQNQSFRIRLGAKFNHHRTYAKGNESRGNS
ncbi:MAG: adenylate/guanylate cyclase domain-containing protein [Sphaerospermopsis sp.]|nr:adenylate/guanylate cyclase domain-containing protein [Sphaerospermopsis sp.]